MGQDNQDYFAFEWTISLLNWLSKLRKSSSDTVKYMGFIILARTKVVRKRRTQAVLLRHQVLLVENQDVKIPEKTAPQPK